MTSRTGGLVSVVIPCYKQAHFLGEAIESVLSQSYRNIEIIVVDDGSPDGTAEVAARYMGVRCLRQANSGLPAARNAGLRQSQGEYVIFLDSDDRLLRDAVGLGIAAMGAHPECAFVCGHNRYIGADGAPIAQPRRPCVGVNYMSLLAHNMIECPASVLYRRDRIEAVGAFDHTLRSCEDHDLYLRMARAYPVMCHHHPVSEYRRHGAGMSLNFERMLKSILRVLGSQKPYVAGNQELESALRTGTDFYRRTFGEGLVNAVRDRVRQRTQWREVLRMVGVLLRYYPRGIVENIGRKARLAMPPRRGR
jgi:glycosyltransferase involved in cell wall biosynthesis